MRFQKEPPDHANRPDFRSARSRLAKPPADHLRGLATPSSPGVNDARHTRGASLRSLPPLAVSVADGRSKTRTPAGLHYRRETSGALSLISVVFRMEGAMRERNARTQRRSPAPGP